MKTHKEKIPAGLKVFTLITFFTSSIVFIEPAPFDVLFMGILAASVAFGYIVFPYWLRAYYLLFGVYFLFSLISVPMAEYINEALSFHAITLYLIILAFVLCFLIYRFGTEFLEMVILTVCYSLAITSAISIAGYFDILPIKDIIIIHGDRLKGFFKDANVLGPACIFANIFLISYILHGRKLLVNSLSLLLCTAALFLTYSRAAWGAFVVAFFLFLVLRFIFNRNKIGFREISLISFSFLCIAGILIFILQSDSLKEFAASRAGMHDYDDDRFAVQALLLDHSMQNPLGAGPGQTELFLFNFFSFIEGSGAAHNLFVRLIFENGFIAAFFFFITLIYIALDAFNLCRKNWKESWQLAPALAIFLSFLMTSFVIDTLHWRHFWILVGVIFGLKGIYYKSISSRSQGR